MRILVVGGGGRESTLCWKLSQSSNVDEIYCIPGNGGIKRIARCENLPYEDDFSSLVDFVKKEKIDFTIVGPEAPLVNGIVDRFQKENLRIFGPSKAAARLEGSKVYAKHFMRKYDIPTAEFETFSSPDDAIEYIDKQDYPLVVKADGLAGGKGSIVTETKQQAREAVEKIMQEKVFGGAGEKVVIERKLEGEEMSFFAITDGFSIKPLVSSRDYKPAYDGNKGPNTGGMGSYSPADLKPQLFRKIMRKIAMPTLQGMQEEGVVYKGVLYIGLMIRADDPKVLEYNCRFGDPETQVTLPRLRTDLIDIIQAVDEETLNFIDLNWRTHVATCVVLASGGYPGEYEKGNPIQGIEETQRIKNVFLFYAGVKEENGNLITDGGRVIGVTGMGKNLKEATTAAYRGVDKIYFEGMHYRRDIGKPGLTK